MAGQLLNDLEWFDIDVWKPGIGKVVIILDIYGCKDNAFYDGDEFISIDENRPISGVGYWAYIE